MNADASDRHLLHFAGIGWIDSRNLGQCRGCGGWRFWIIRQGGLRCTECCRVGRLEFASGTVDIRELRP